MSLAHMINACEPMRRSLLGVWYHSLLWRCLCLARVLLKIGGRCVCTYVCAFFFFFCQSSGGGVKIKLKLPHFHVSGTCVSI